MERYMYKICRLFFAIFLLFFAVPLFSQPGSVNDFSKAQIVFPENVTIQEQAAIKLLGDEIEKRTLIKIPTFTQWSAGLNPLIVVSTLTSFQKIQGFPAKEIIPASSDNKPEGFQIKLIKGEKNVPTVLIIGNDSRGMLYGIGCFLRKITMGKNQLFVPNNISVQTSPVVALRGHQLGYRPKTNAYDGMDEALWEQYIRDLIVFGTNAIELMPPHTDDDADSPMFPLPQMDMMVAMDNILDKYGIDAWIWYPLMFKDYTSNETIKKGLDESENIFSKLKRVDAIFIPGGDPGHVQPKVLFKYLEKQAQVLHKYHPKAELWVSPQGFQGSWMDEFFELLKQENKWLTGIVYGPQLSMDINSLRKMVPGKYPIRRYPDITHSFDSQYPVPNWDFAYAATQNREGINPRPLDQAAIFRATPVTSNQGFITYSEGLNDDVNKIIWSGLGWKPQGDVRDILQDYSRYFIGPDYTYDFTEGLYNLEQNWNGSLMRNNLVNVHQGIFQTMEKKASPQVRLNWRFQMALYRSYYDTYNRSRLIYETQLELEAMDLLRKASVSGSLLAMQQASNVLNKARTNQVALDIRQRVYELAEALFQSTRMQLSVSKYFAIGTRRGANLDLIEYPLNNQFWLQGEFTRIAAIDKENNRLIEIDKVLNWTNPGPGGFYDDLGDLGNQPHLVQGEEYQLDPAFYRSPFVGFSAYERTKNWRVSWQRYMQTLHGHPLKMHYQNLDSAATYSVKVTYIGEGVGLKANNILIHDYLEKRNEITPLNFDIPVTAIKEGKLTLEFSTELGKGGTGRGCQIGEVWLIKREKLADQ